MSMIVGHQNNVKKLLTVRVQLSQQCINRFQSLWKNTHTGGGPISLSLLLLESIKLFRIYSKTNRKHSAGIRMRFDQVKLKGLKKSFVLIM